METKELIMKATYFAKGKKEYRFQATRLSGIKFVDVLWLIFLPSLNNAAKSIAKK